MAPPVIAAAIVCMGSLAGLALRYQNNQRNQAALDQHNVSQYNAEGRLSKLICVVACELQQ